MNGLSQIRERTVNILKSTLYNSRMVHFSFCCSVRHITHYERRNAGKSSFVDFAVRVLVIIVNESSSRNPGSLALGGRNTPKRARKLRPRLEVSFELGSDGFAHKGLRKRTIYPEMVWPCAFHSR